MSPLDLHARQLTLEQLEDRLVPAGDILAMLGTGFTAFYSIDGSGNNLAHTEWGSTDSNLLRIASAAYGDGISTPAGSNRPGPRVISNAIANAEGESTVNDRLLSAMIHAWGQFIDHDMDLTRTGTTETIRIAIPTGDPSFDPQGTGNKTLQTTRSVFDPTTGTGTKNPRQQINALSAFLDGSMIYGSDATTAASLRTFAGGKMKTSDGDLLPLAAPNSTSFVAGDIRVNENTQLASMHTLFVREHNYWAGRLAASFPKLNDEQLYQRARTIVIAEVQSVTYNQWLPALLGNNALPAYRGYNPNVNPGIANEFSTAGFRFGHTLLGEGIGFLDNNGQAVADEISLRDAFFNTEPIHELGIDPLLKFLASDPAEELDTKIVDSVRNFLFGQPGSGGLDLASLNIARGRDHGLADYNSTRAAYGLPRVKTFAQITSDPELQAQLKTTYGSVDKIDLWVGALAEDNVPGASVGQLTRAILVDQFTRLRDGDRMWYQRILSGPLLKEIERTSLADIIERNTDLTNLQDNVFFFKAGISGTVFADTNANGRLDRGERALVGQTVQLVDQSTGTVVATAKTNAKGEYVFDVVSGLRTGTYQVRLVSAANQQQTTVLRTIEITRGDQFVRNNNIGVANTTQKQPARTEQAGHGHTDEFWATNVLQQLKPPLRRQ